MKKGQTGAFKITRSRDGSWGYKRVRVKRKKK